MYKKNHRGFLAEQLLLKTKKEEQDQHLACGHFIESSDYFEQEKLNLMHQFNEISIDDDIYVAQHRDHLI